MQEPSANHAGRRIARLLATSMLCALVLICGTLAGSPTLHEHVHHDAEHAEHQCAISLFAHGLVHFESPAPVLAVPHLDESLPPLPAVERNLSADDLALPQGRGPPAACL